MILIDVDFLRTLFVITKNGQVDIPRKITEAQNFDLKKTIGDAFFADIENNALLPQYVLLLNGGTYENENGNNVTFAGLKTALAYFAYARLIDVPNNLSYTEYGIVRKISNLSEPIDAKVITRGVDMNRQIAVDYLNEVLKYVDFAKTNYPLYENSCSAKIDVLNTSFIGIKRNANPKIKRY